MKNKKSGFHDYKYAKINPPAFNRKNLAYFDAEILEVENFFVLFIYYNYYSY
jgi:hypothetical protein